MTGERSAAIARQIEGGLALTVTCNLLGLPAAVVPVGVAHGLPQAVQIIGARFEELTCLEAAQLIEAARGSLTPIDPDQSRGTGEVLSDLTRA